MIFSFRREKKKMSAYRACGQTDCRDCRRGRRCNNTIVFVHPDQTSCDDRHPRGCRCMACCPPPKPKKRCVYFAVSRLTVLNLTSGTPTTIPFEAINVAKPNGNNCYNPCGDMFGPSYNLYNSATGILTIPSDSGGLYQLNVSVEVSATNLTNFLLQLMNGVSEIDRHNFTVAAGQTGTGKISIAFPVQAGSQLSVVVTADAAGASVSNLTTRFSGFLAYSG